MEILMADIFDQLATPQPAQPHPSAEPVSSPAADRGDIFDQVATPTQSTKPTPTQSAQPKSAMRKLADAEASPVDKAARWAQQVQDDINHGTDITGIGKVMKSLGSHGIDNSDHPLVGQMLALLPNGILNAVKGQAELAGSGVRPGQSVSEAARQGLQGLTDEVAGEGEAGAIPAVAGGLTVAGQAGAVPFVASQIPTALGIVKHEVAHAAGHEILKRAKHAVQDALSE
jgi:hypothetical protein